MSFQFTSTGNVKEFNPTALNESCKKLQDIEMMLNNLRFGYNKLRKKHCEDEKRLNSMKKQLDKSYKDLKGLRDPK